MLFRNTLEGQELKHSFINIGTISKLHELWIDHLQNERQNLVKDWVYNNQLNQGQTVSGSFFAK